MVQLTRLYVSLNQFSVRNVRHNVCFFARTVSPYNICIHIYIRTCTKVNVWSRVMKKSFLPDFISRSLRWLSVWAVHVCVRTVTILARVCSGIDAYSFLHISVARYTYPWIPWATRRECHRFNHKFRFPSRRETIRFYLTTYICDSVMYIHRPAEIRKIICIYLIVGDHQWLLKFWSTLFKIR